MTNQDLDLDEKPLDPATEKIRKKMVRLLGVSIGVMMIGLMAVLGAIVYKFTTSTQKAPAQTTNAAQQLNMEMVSGSIDLPDGAEILDSDIDGGQILLRLKIKESVELWIYDVASNKTVAKLKLQ